jgi:hypothetical protein
VPSLIPVQNTRKTHVTHQDQGTGPVPQDRGLGTTITGYHLNGRQADVAGLLGIPDDVTQIALLPVAYTTTTDFHPAARPRIEAITYYDRWGHTQQG